MKNLQKLILPVLIIIVVGLIYTFYFSKNSDLGSFSDFDRNNSAVKEIRVEIVQSRGINNNIFYVKDKTGQEVLVQADAIPPGMESAKTVILKGHLNQDSFHAHEVLID